MLLWRVILSKIKFNVIYSNSNVSLENLLDDLTELKRNSLIWSIKNDNKLIYNKEENYLSTRIEVDKK